MDDAEDGMTATYLHGHGAAGGTRRRRCFRSTKSAGMARVSVGPDDQPLGAVFKLYPWEWMVREEFGKYLGHRTDTIWIEPPWKMLLSNKGILPVLWELYPGHPNLLEASFESPRRDDALGQEAVCWAAKAPTSRFTKPASISKPAAITARKVLSIRSWPL